MNQEKTDRALIADILNENQKSFEILYERYNKLYMSICLRYFNSRSDAEDMLQESVIKIYRSLEGFDSSKGAFITWSKKIVINTCLQKLRRPRIISFFDSMFQYSNEVPIYSTALEDLNLQDLTKIIQNLPIGYRTVFNMYVIDGYTHREIADTLKISVSTSKTQLMKAKKILKTRVGNEFLIFEQQYA